jgi:hypothetical protein
MLAVVPLWQDVSKAAVLNQAVIENVREDQL